MKVSTLRGLPRKKPARLPLEPLPGGKALARLHQFELERNLEPSEVGFESPLKALVPPVGPPTGPRPQARGEKPEESPYLMAFQERERMAPAVPVPVGWRPLGPFSIPHGQTYGSGPGSRPSVSGRISAVAVDPGDANHILIGAAGGGLWETKDGGSTWQPRTDNQPSLAMGAIVFDPSNPAVVYAGTGEGDFFSRLGAGLLRSTDGGATWTLHAAAPFAGNGFYDLVVDPLNGNHLLAATTIGIYESTDGGAAWTQRRTQRTWDLSMHPVIPGDPNSTTEVFAACGDGLQRSTDGGATWSAVSLPGAPASYNRLEVCHAPSDGSVVYAYAAGAGVGFLWRRNTFGGDFASEAFPAGLSTNQAWYDWFAAVAPNNPDVLYLGAIDLHKGVRSPANTWTWTNISAKAAGDSIHPDQHHIAFSPVDPNVIFVGNDGGIYRSPDGGTSWKSLNKGLCITEFEYLAQHPQYEAWLIGGTQDNGTQRYEGSELWFHVADGDGGDCAVNAASPYTCYHSYYSMTLERSTSGGGWGSWTYIPPPVPSNHSSLFYPPLEVLNNVVVQAGQRVFISSDTGTTWTDVALPGNRVASALAIPSVTRIYAGTTDGNVYYIDFVGGSWQAPVALTQPRVGFVSDLFVDPTNPNRLWATYSSMGGSHVFRSDNGGTNWNDVSAGLPIIPVNAVAVDPANTNRVWVAADVGVYQSLDAGATWQNFNNLLPNALAKDLVFHAPSRLLRVATQSRGVWEIAVDAGTMQDVEVYLRDSVVDTGRLSPSPSGVADPFNLGAFTHWWECTDIKVDAPSYQTVGLGDVDFELFEDDHGVFFSGFLHENSQRNRTVRVFVQVHNRGLNPATNIAVKAFFADASVGLPNLPSGFWTNFPNNVLPAASPWQAIAPHKVIPTLEGGKAKVVGFEWAVPGTAADHTCLLAVLSADNDSISTTELNIGALVTNQKKCGLKNLHVVNPPPIIGPFSKIIKLHLWPYPSWKKFSLALQGNGAIVRGIVLSRHLVQFAQKAKLRKIDLTEDDRVELANLVRRFPKLRDKLDLTTAFQVQRKGMWLKSFELEKETSDVLVVLVNPRNRRGSCALIQQAEDGRVIGGFTLQVI